MPLRSFAARSALLACRHERRPAGNGRVHDRRVPQVVSLRISIARSASVGAAFLLVFSNSAFGQGDGGPHGPGFKLGAVSTFPFSWGGGAAGGGGTAESAVGVAVEFSFSISPTVVPYVAVEYVWTSLDNPITWNVYRAGVNVRFPLGPAVVPYASVGIGQLSGDPPGFTFAALGGGLEVFPTRRFALHYAFQIGKALGDATIGPTGLGVGFPVNDTYRRHIVGFSWYFGGRGGHDAPPP